MSVDRQSFMLAGHGILNRMNGGMSMDEACSEWMQMCRTTFSGDKQALVVAQIQMMVGYDWGRCGFPTVELSHKLAASLCATSIPTEHLSDVTLPWGSFCLLIPSGLMPFSLGSPSFAIITSKQLTGSQFDDVGVSYICGGAEFQGLAIGSEPRLSDYAKAEFVGHANPLDPSTGKRAWSEDDLVEQQRLALLVGRLLIGCCIELGQPHYAASRSAAPPPRVKRGLPKSWRFQLTRNVNLNCVEFIKDYARGRHRGGGPTVQVLVRGHHRWQPHGPLGSLRKWIHVEPYWRGPEDAAIAVRTHVVGEANL